MATTRHACLCCAPQAADAQILLGHLHKGMGQGLSCHSQLQDPSVHAYRYNGPNLVLKYDKARGRLVNVAEDEHSSPYYALRDRPGNAIGVTACDVDGDGREEIYFLNTNNAFSGELQAQGGARHGCP